MMGRPTILLMLAAALLFAGCGSGSEVTRADWLRILKDVMRSDVTTRDVNHDNSRTLQEALDDSLRTCRKPSSRWRDVLTWEL